MYLRFEADNLNATLVEPMRVEVAPIGSIEVPAGFSTDGRSIPWWLWSLSGGRFEPRYLPAAIVHDWLCDEARQRNDYPLRVIADAVFFYVLANDPKISWFMRTAMYAAVRGYGRLTYKTVRRSAP